MVIETAIANVHFESISGRPKLLRRKFMVDSRAVRPIENLDKGVRPAAPDNPGDKGETMALGRVNNLEVPPLKKRRALPL
jgi:hypothetical protein